MSRTSDWAGQIREEERRREDDNAYGYTAYLEAMYEIQRQRQQKQQRKPKQQK